MPRYDRAGAMSDLTLHGYWRSSASYRVRIALALKGVDYAQVTHDLRSGAQRAPDYRALAPQGLVPALVDGDSVLTQSGAILEWIEARWAQPALLPADPGDAAIVRAMAGIIACDIHPLGNLRVLQALRQDFGADEDQVRAWIARWTGEGLAALETLVARHGGTHAFGDAPSFADCHIVPQLYNARRFGVDLTPFPRLCAVDAAACALPAFAAAHPDRQPDADA
jgi:maleylpyruvate isomerase